MLSIWGRSVMGKDLLEVLSFLVGVRINRDVGNQTGLVVFLLNMNHSADIKFSSILCVSLTYASKL